VQFVIFRDAYEDPALRAQGGFQHGINGHCADAFCGPLPAN